MLYLSQLLGAPLENTQQVRIGKISDILVETGQIGRAEAAYPSALLIVGEEEQHWRIPPTALTRQEHTWRIFSPLEQFSSTPAQITKYEISLAGDVLDKQVINVEQKKAIRVSDVCFADDWRILGVDATTPGLLRRLAPGWLSGLKNLPATLIPWQQIEPLTSQRPTDEDETPSPLSIPTPHVPGGQLAELHPADIASIVHQLTAEQGARVLERLDDELAADTMEEVDTERQSSIMENIQPERASLILQAMGPDEAADLLAQFSDERKEQLLRLMNPEESEEVQELLTYEDDSAGGLMTTDYLGLNATHKVQDALTTIRTAIRENDMRMAYIYCVADETRDKYQLIGVVSLWDLLAADSIQTLQEIMETDLITAQPDSDPHTVAETMAKYNLLALPVVSEEGILVGVVTVDDVLDFLLPPERRRKPRRMY